MTDTNSVGFYVVPEVMIKEGIKKLTKISSVKAFVSSLTGTEAAIAVPSYLTE